MIGLGLNAPSRSEDAPSDDKHSSEFSETCSLVKIGHLQIKLVLFFANSCKTMVLEDL